MRSSQSIQSCQVNLVLLSRLASFAMIVFGAALSGWLLGDAIGPVTLRLDAGQMGGITSCAGILAAIVGCSMALERKEARERTRQQVDFLLNPVRNREGGSTRHSADVSPSTLMRRQLGQ